MSSARADFKRRSLRAFAFFCVSLATPVLAVDTARAVANLPSVFTIQGTLVGTDGSTPLTEAGVVLTLGLYAPSGQCLLYEEHQTLSNLAQMQGAFTVLVGSPPGDAKRTSRDPGLALSGILYNRGTIRVSDGASGTCPSGYAPAAGDIRNLRVTVFRPSTGAQETLSPDLVLSPVPQAMVADTLQGFVPENFIQVEGNVQQQNLDLLTGGQDASALHNHDGRYVKIGGTQNVDLGTGRLGLGGVSSPSAQLQIQNQSATSPVVVVQGAQSQAQPYFQIKDSSGNVLFAIDKNGFPTLAGDPTSALGAATKQYVDALNAFSSTGSTVMTGGLTFDGSAARTISENRNPVSGGAGGSLTLSAGGAASGATNSNGGALVLSAGTATGTGSSSISFQTAGGGSTGTSDTAPTTKMSILGNGNVGIGTTTPSDPLEVDGKITSSIALADPSSDQVGMEADVGASLLSATSSKNLYGVNTWVTMNGFKSATGSLYGVRGYAASLNNGNIGSITGVAAIANANGSGGTATSVQGVYAQSGASIDQPAANVYGVFVDTPYGSGSTNIYGLYVKNQSGGTNNFGIYSAGGLNYFGGNVGVGVAPSAVNALTVNGVIAPAADNTNTLGTAGARFTTVYATTSTINTSDRREKTDITDSALGLAFINRLRPVSYEWKKKAPEKEGTFYGFIAQEVEQALKGAPFAGLVHDKSTDLYGLRYSEFISPLVKAVQELSSKVTNLFETTDAVSRDLSALQKKTQEIETRNHALEDENRALRQDVSALREWACSQPGARPGFCKR